MFKKILIAVAFVLGLAAAAQAAPQLQAQVAALTDPTGPAPAFTPPAVEPHADADDVDPAPRLTAVPGCPDLKLEGLTPLQLQEMGALCTLREARAKTMTYDQVIAERAVLTEALAELVKDATIFQPRLRALKTADHIQAGFTLADVVLIAGRLDALEERIILLPNSPTAREHLLQVLTTLRVGLQDELTKADEPAPQPKAKPRKAAKAKAPMNLVPKEVRSGTNPAWVIE